MTNKAIEYLKTNKDSHQKDDLVVELKNTGFSDVDIEEAVKEVYGQSDSSSSDKQEKAPSSLSRGQKIGQFLLGFVSMVIANYVVSYAIAISFLNEFINDGNHAVVGSVIILLIIANIAWIKYTFMKGNRYFAVGLTVAVILPFLFYGGCFLLLDAF